MVRWRPSRLHHTLHGEEPKPDRQFTKPQPQLGSPSPPLLSLPLYPQTIQWGVSLSLWRLIVPSPQLPCNVRSAPRLCGLLSGMHKSSIFTHTNLFYMCNSTHTHTPSYSFIWSQNPSVVRVLLEPVGWYITPGCSSVGVDGHTHIHTYCFLQAQRNKWKPNMRRNR